MNLTRIPSLWFPIYKIVLSFLQFTPKCIGLKQKYQNLAHPKKGRELRFSFEKREGRQLFLSKNILKSKTI